MSSVEVLWKDRRRRLGLPLSFTKYRLTEDRIFCETGLLNTHEEEILLYRVRDLELRRSLGQRIFGVGSVIIHSSDTTMPTLELKSVKNSRDVKELLYRQVEECKDQRRMRTTELVGEDAYQDADGQDFMDP